MRPPRLSRWLLLVALAICLPDRAPASETGNLEQLRDYALELVNKDRRERGLDRLSHGSALNTAAQTPAEDMLQRDY